MKTFCLQIDEPSIVAQGENTGWGDYQFPDISYTKNGSILVSWTMRPDDYEAVTGKAYGEAVSDDGGITWRERRESDVVVSGSPLSNGRAFKGFERQYAFECDYIKNYTHVAEYKGRKYYFLEDIKEYDRKVKGVERDVESGEELLFDAELRWKNLSLVEYAGGRVLPTSYMLTVCGSAPQILTLSDGLYFATYHWSFDINSKTREEAVRAPYLDMSVFIFRSTDDARTWECISQIAPDEDIYKNAIANGFEGLDEPQMELMADGSVVVLMRSGSPSGQNDPNKYPSYIARSTDNCRTWSKPEEFDKLGVLPQIKRLGCGAIIASYGRPGLFVKVSGDESGMVWSDPIEIKLATNLSEESCYDRSCYYTRLLPLDDHSALLVYSDFNYPENGVGESQKSILVRKLTVIEK
jgi:hypothetical protein